MKFRHIFLISFLPLMAQSPVERFWGDMEVKRSKLESARQEFEITYKSEGYSYKQRSILDIAGPLWREQRLTSSGHSTEIFDGTHRYQINGDSTEYRRIKGDPQRPPTPAPYELENPDWSRAVETTRRPCGLPGLDHECVQIEIPLKPWFKLRVGERPTRRVRGGAMYLFDSTTGLLISARIGEAFESERGAHQHTVNIVLKVFSTGKPIDKSVFALPPAAREVKEFSRWRAAEMRKQLSGKPAPDLTVTTLKGEKISLSDYRGKLVLLDFWATWCPPCRADGPALDKLYSKYGSKELAILGISVGEERAIVEKFLTEHPHNFPIALSTDSRLPKEYQIGVFPTYIVIDKDGNFTAAVEGDQGFGELRKLLKKAGLDVD